MSERSFLRAQHVRDRSTLELLGARLPNLDFESAV